eukprot:2942119-Amphidinium_carterae.1
MHIPKDCCRCCFPTAVGTTKKHVANMTELKRMTRTALRNYGLRSIVMSATRHLEAEGLHGRKLCKRALPFTITSES